MVVGAFPAAKLGALLLKQISKPIANIVKNQAKSSPIFRKYVCMPPAQFYNWCEVKSKMWILNLGRPVNIPVLNEQMAIELGANLLGEGIIFLIAAGILINEYSRSAAKEAAKEAAKKKELMEIQSAIRDLYIQAEEERAQIREILRKLGEQDTELQILGKKIGIRANKDEHPLPVVPEPPPYSPVITDPNLTDSDKPESTISHMSKREPEIYQLNRHQEHPGLILRTLEEVKREFWSYPFEEYQPNALSIALIYVHKIIFKSQV